MFVIAHQAMYGTSDAVVKLGAYLDLGACLQGAVDIFVGVDGGSLAQDALEGFVFGESLEHQAAKFGEFFVCQVWVRCSHISESVMCVFICQTNIANKAHHSHKATVVRASCWSIACRRKRPSSSDFPGKRANSRYFPLLYLCLIQRLYTNDEWVNNDYSPSMP